MNVGEINPGTHGTLPQYVAVTLPFTIMTAWIIIAFQSKYLMPGTTFFQRLGWPVTLVYTMLLKKREPHTHPEKLVYSIGGEQDH